MTRESSSKAQGVLRSTASSVGYPARECQEPKRVMKDPKCRVQSFFAYDSSMTLMYIPCEKIVFDPIKASDDTAASPNQADDSSFEGPYRSRPSLRAYSRLRAY